MKRINTLLFFILLIITNCNNEDQGKILIWDYNENLIYEDLNNKSIEELLLNYNYMEIPLNYFKYYYWDEQILFMDQIIFDENNYYDKLNNIKNKSDSGSLFYSAVINNKIVYNGLNRILPNWYAAMEPYDNTNYPRITMKKNINGIFFFFTFSEYSSLGGWSIWNLNTVNSINYSTDNPQINSRGDQLFVGGIKNDIQILFNKDMYNYYNKKNKIIRGRFDIVEIIDNGNFKRIE